MTHDARARLAGIARGAAEIVALSVDATTRTLAAIVAARPSRTISNCTAGRARSGSTKSSASSASRRSRRSASPRPPISRAADAYKAADALLIDAKPPKGAVLPGGNGVAVRLAARQDFHPRKPWLLSGGLDAATSARRSRSRGARGVDVSSGVESAPGVKDIEKINAFVAAARAAFASDDIAQERSQ